jgi:lipoprotein-anchoring transpeptidase ErfK/SrfK
VQPTERWIDIDLGSQTLVAYDGDRAVWAALVSTGQGVYSTPTGVFRMYAKREKQTMSNRGHPGLPPYYFEDVPWVQFFNQNIALHGAYWHRRFGQPVSHGCVNLAPDDAKWLYDFTRLPDPLRPGTLVRVR